MLAIFYIIISFLLGKAICSYVFPAISKVVKYSFEKESVSISPIFFYLPIWYVVGTLLLTWLTYLVACIFGKSDTPLYFSNLIILPSMTVLILVGIVYKYKRHREDGNWISDVKTLFACSNKELWYITISTMIAISVMCFTFYQKYNTLYVGATVYSDFSPHIGMIRSFSVGNNYPTMYSHYTGEDVRYHFMYQFLVGNLEYLGLPIDIAFNLPSILSFVFVLMLIYVLAVKITKNTWVGYLSGLMFVFRSSSTFFLYLASLPKGQILSTLRHSIEFIGTTPNESWGLWNINVYANQRHLPFSLCVLLIVIILMLPKVYYMYEELVSTGGWKGIRVILSTMFCRKESWVVRDNRKVLMLGMTLGMIAFWNGATFIATLTLLFFMAIISKNRLEYLFIALISGCLSIIQSNVFIKGNAIKPMFYYGFIADNRTFFGTMEYLIKLLGIVSILLAVIFILEKGIKRILILIFMMPLVFAFTVSLTVDVTVNHKYIMMAVMLLNILIADSICKWFQKSNIIQSVGCVILCLLLTGTGIFDFYTYFNRNHNYQGIALRNDDLLTLWIEDNSDSKDIFLTSNYSLNQVVYGGAMLYYGWPYYAWSAGYDTEYRMEQVKLMYEANSSEELQFYVKRNKIDFVIIDRDNRVSNDYVLNENTIRNTYQIVYEDGEGEYSRIIFDTSKIISNTKER